MTAPRGLRRGARTAARFADSARGPHLIIGNGGGGTVWDAMVYDESAGLFHIGTGNGAPWNRDHRSPGGSDNLYLRRRPDLGVKHRPGQRAPGRDPGCTLWIDRQERLPGPGAERSPQLAHHVVEPGHRPLDRPGRRDHRLRLDPAAALRRSTRRPPASTHRLRIDHPSPSASWLGSVVSSTTLNRRSPAGSWTVTSSPSRAPVRPLPMGDSREM